MQRKRLTNAQKLAIIVDFDQRLAAGESKRSIAESHGVQAVQIRDWKEKIAQLSTAGAQKKSLARGPDGRLAHLEQQIIGWALEMRESGVSLKYRHLQLRASQLFPEFKNLSSQAQYETIRRLCIKNVLFTRKVAHTAQEHHQMTVDRSKGFLSVVRPIFSAPEVNKKYIINMDQTAVYTSMHPNTTLELVGPSTIHRKLTGNGAYRFICCLAISADGDKLKPFVIFQGTPTERNATRELPTTSHRNNEVALTCQEAAWQDEQNMLRWIEVILVPYLEDKPDGVPVHLVLDSFKVHWTPRVQGRLRKLGVTCHEIPRGCNCLVQPIDVGIGKLFKDKIKEKFLDRMKDTPEDAATVPAASREDGMDWVVESWNKITEDNVRNSWLRKDFEFFL